MAIEPALLITIISLKIGMWLMILKKVVLASSISAMISSSRLLLLSRHSNLIAIKIGKLFLLILFLRQRSGYILGKTFTLFRRIIFINIEMEHGIVPFVAIEFIEGHELYGNSLRGFIAKASFNLELILNIAISICNGMLHIQNKF